MILEALVELDAPISGGADQVYSAARRFWLQPQCPVRRALIQTQATMDALIEFREIQRGDLRPSTVVLFLRDVVQD